MAFQRSRPGSRYWPCWLLLSVRLRRWGCWRRLLVLLLLRWWVYCYLARSTSTTLGGLRRYLLWRRRGLLLLLLLVLRSVYHLWQYCCWAQGVLVVVERLWCISPIVRLLLLLLLRRLLRLLPLRLLLLLLRLRQAGCGRLDGPHVDFYPSIFDEQFDNSVWEYL